MKTELMNKAMVALFTDMEVAQQAVENLEARGFARADVSLFQRDDDIENLSDIAMLELDEEEINDLQNGFTTSHVILTVKPTAKHQEVMSILSESKATTILTSHASYHAEATQDNYAVNDRIEAVDLPNREKLDYQLAEDLHEVDNKTFRSEDLRGEINLDREDLELDNQTVQLHEEKLNINKEQIQSGEVVIRKEIITENKTVEVPVTREEVVIERHSVPKHSTNLVDGDFDNVQEVARIEVSEERLNIEKVPMIKEIVNIKKVEVTDNQKVTETLRHEEAEIREDGNVIIHDERKDI